jgi:hypothetical protein
MNNTDGHYQDNRAEIFLANVSAMQAAGIQAVLFGAGNAGQTTYTDARGDGITNNNGASTTDVAGGCIVCNTHVSSYADDDGAYLRIFVGRFYHPFPLNRTLPPVLVRTIYQRAQPVPPALPQRTSNPARPLASRRLSSGSVPLTN